MRREADEALRVLAAPATGRTPPPSEPPRAQEPVTEPSASTAAPAETAETPEPPAFRGPGRRRGRKGRFEG